MVIGENQKFLTALITLRSDVNLQTGIPSINLTPDVRNVIKTLLDVDVKTTEEAIANVKI